jgi:hypothetical protein
LIQLQHNVQIIDAYFFKPAISSELFFQVLTA